MADWRLLNTKTWDIKDPESWSIIWRDLDQIDFSSNTDLINKYPNEASFKNNNPTGITFQGMSDELKSMLDNAWVQYSMWTARPIWEGWNYVKFDTVQDWLNAYTVALTQRWDDIKNRLATWVWTQDTIANDKYATDLMQKAWIEEGTRFSELSQDQLWALMSAQLQRESPNFYNELANIQDEAPVELTLTDINTFNNTTFKEKDLKTKEQKAKYAEFLKTKKSIMWDKEADIQDILAYSAWGRWITWEIVKPLQKFDQALSQLWDIQDQISDMDTWPIIWRLKW